MAKAKYPSAPFVEIGMYFREQDSQASLRRVASYLLTQGENASIRSVTTIPRMGRAHGSSRHADTENLVERRVHLETVSALDQLTTDRVVRLEIAYSEAIVQGAMEIIAEAPISDAACARDHNPIEIWIEGQAFSGPPGLLGNPAKLGRSLYRRMRELTKALRPAYMAVYGEETIRCPSDLRTGSCGGTFENVYVATEEFGKEPLTQLIADCKAAFSEWWDDGVYLSNWADVNPKHRKSEAAGEISARIGRWIGRKYRRD
jgi:hypothetical protein